MLILLELVAAIVCVVCVLRKRFPEQPIEVGRGHDERCLDPAIDLLGMVVMKAIDLATHEGAQTRSRTKALHDTELNETLLDRFDLAMVDVVKTLLEEDNVLAVRTLLSAYGHLVAAPCYQIITDML
jgi:hypothetical protein